MLDFQGSYLSCGFLINSDPLFTFHIMMWQRVVLHCSQDERDDFVGGSKTLETAFYHELACEERSLHGFAEACRVEFLSALGAFGVRKLGQLQTSVQCSMIDDCILVLKEIENEGICTFC